MGLGQINRIKELDSSEYCLQRASSFVHITFGDAYRIKELKLFLCELRSRGIELVICTRWMVGTVKYCLETLGMLDLFTKIIGRTGSSYGVTSYDECALMKPFDF